MKVSNRRDFLKTCVCVAGFCGFSSFFNLSAKEKDSDGNSSLSVSEAERNEAFALHWIRELLQSLDGCRFSETQLRDIVKNTFKAHHDLLNVPEMVKPYIGEPDRFIDFLQNAWGWIVTDNTAEKTLIVDENKPFCVCPLMKHSNGNLFPALCFCSEGFAEKMFSMVYQHPVSVTVAASVQRGDPSCIYRIKY